MGSNINVSIIYVLDDAYSSTIPLIKYYRGNISASVTYMGSVPLPEISDGSHKIDVYCRIEIYNFGANGVYHQKYVYSRNATVYFTIYTDTSMTSDSSNEIQQQPGPPMNSALILITITMITVAGLTLTAYSHKSKLHK